MILPNQIIFDINAANALLRHFVMEILGLADNRVLIETKAGPRPSDGSAYCTIYWRDQELLPQFDGDMDWQEVPDEDEYPFINGIETRENSALCTVRFSIWGDDAYNLASELRFALDSANRNFDLWTVLGFAGVGNVQDLSSAFGGKIQQRAFVELSFYVRFGRRYDLDWFNRVPFAINNDNHIYPKESEPCPQIP